jgi:hypothetical protein
MKIRVILISFFIVLSTFLPLAMAQDLETVTGTLIDITREMYTVKTDSDQGFRGARSTFVVDPNTTETKGELKVGARVQAEVDQNGHAYSVKVLDNNVIQPKAQ